MLANPAKLAIALVLVLFGFFIGRATIGTEKMVPATKHHKDVPKEHISEVPKEHISEVPKEHISEDKPKIDKLLPGIPECNPNEEKWVPCSASTVACKPPNNLTFYSQVIGMQDRVIYENAYQARCEGFFVDIGAFDGASLSNTKFFEESLGWHGICIEPSPPTYESLVKNRPKCINKNAAVGNANRKIKFLLADPLSMLNGIYDFMSEQHKQRIDSELRAMHLDPEKQKQLIDIDMINLQDYLISIGERNIDMLSIDTEGAELAVLNTIDFLKINVNILTVERNQDAEAVRNLLAEKGFQRVSPPWFPHSLDDTFVNPCFCKRVSYFKNL